MSEEFKEVTNLNGIDIIKFGTKEIRDIAEQDGTYSQLEFATTLPGIRFIASMPDCHVGYTFPIGSVVAVDIDEGHICPGGIGFDIGCGMRVITTEMSENDLGDDDQKKELAHELSRSCPAGVYSEGNGTLSEYLDDILIGKWDNIPEDELILEDFENCEDGGRLKLRDIPNIPQDIKSRGMKQLGSVGSGNHFVEVDVVKAIHNDSVAEVFGLTEGQVVVQIHCGSRGFGYKLCARAIDKMAEENGLTKNKESAHVKFNSELGKEYFAHMVAASNYAYMNRYILGQQVRKAFYSKYGYTNMPTLYDLQHNIAKMELHPQGMILVMRKGATRAYGKTVGSVSIPTKYRSVGQPVLIPGSMGSDSYILCGLDKSEELSFSSSCHGAGRAMGRKASSREEGWEETSRKLNQAGIIVKTQNKKELSEERPEAYKDASEVVRAIDGVGIASKVATLSPLIVVKG